MSYKKLEIWQLAREVVIETHQITLELPAFELYEEGRQIRKSTKSTKSNIVEGYGRRHYKQEYIRFIIYALASNDESLDHLENLLETGSFSNVVRYQKLHALVTRLGIKLNHFLSAIEKIHQSPK